MMAIMVTWFEDASCVQDNTLHYLFLLLFKVGLNVLILASCFRSLRASFMGISGASLCLADLLLLCCITYVWLCGPDTEGPGSISMCFLLAHASTIYASLPLPVLLLGLLDHALHLRLGSQRTQTLRLPTCCAVVLLVWLLAALHSYWHTDTAVVEVMDEGRHVALLCAVRGSSVVLAFCMVFSVAVVCVLLLSCHRASLWTGHLATVQPEDGKQPIDDEGEVSVTPGLAAPPARPLFLNLALGFTLNWTPFLIINIACALLGFATPSYIMVNLLWLLCANSVMVTTVFWYRGGQLGYGAELPDDTCMWMLNWHTQPGLDWQGTVPKHIYTVSGKEMTDPLLV
ncbi:probable G-protein coupled receptor 160 [Brienomyrus brachyistius]|uniref:probable G-protein coupled receptor 160 n=1 Tax=Brienomyrus brachyistius TaxID=42636 RepID=UPI0020B28188|nr:probable G-protein coupled receptor 160 [Brienomyrus brachyistius]XP_048873181.1 probable G-protein coupled receptor 160 [Brienomyrus brachyistius]XP_048873182.1 probable G-protein coupled receptor 160 [Brienomyrus brachyistius]